MARKKKKTQEYIECQNDHTKLVGEYCHTCGQPADEPRRAVIGLVQDVFIDTLAIDGKLARTIFLLLWRPGVLARRYLDGRRVHYSPPFRLYLFTSVFFFLSVFGLIGGENPATSPDEIETEIMRELALQDEATKAEALEALEAVGMVERDGDSEDASHIPFTERKWNAEDYDGPAWLEPYSEKLFGAAQRVVQDPRLFMAESRQNLPRMLLLAPLLYALTLILFYIYRRKFYVYDHFVVSLYMHAALYAYLLMAILLNFLPGPLALLAAAPLFWGAFQPLLVLRQAYGSGWVSAVLKSIVMVLIYVTGLALIIMLGLAYSLYQS